jgi:hypothetical protein
MQNSWFMVEIPTRIALLSSCIMLGVSCKRILSRIPVERKTGQWSPATLQAMTYPIHKNCLRRSLTLYILHLPLLLSSVWNGMTSSPSRCADSANCLHWYGRCAFCNVPIGFVPTCTIMKFCVLRKMVNCMNRPISKYRFFKNYPTSCSLFFNRKLKCVASIKRNIHIHIQQDATLHSLNKSPTRCNNFPVYYPDVYYRSTRFGRFPTHYQELNDCKSSLWFYLRIVLIVVLFFRGRAHHEHITAINTIRW